MGSSAEKEPHRLAACERQNWDPEEYGYDDPCIIALGFDPSIYFSDQRELPDVLSLDSLVDAVYWPGLQGVAWAFAIDHYCPGVVGPAVRCNFDDRRLILRAVSWKHRSEMPSKWEWIAPKSKDDARQLLSSTTNWREADLRTCRGAVKKLLALEKVRWMSFNTFDRSWITTGRSDIESLIITADGDTVLTRAGSHTETVVSLDKGWDGSPGEWAIEMMEVVEPCLKSATAPAPWMR